MARLQPTDNTIGRSGCGAGPWAGECHLCDAPAGAYVNSGNAALNAGDYPAAIDAFTLALKYRPDYVEALTGRGAAYAREGRARQVIADFGRAIALGPGNAQAHYGRGMAYAALGQAGPAIADFQQVLLWSDDPILTKAGELRLIALEQP